MWSTDNCKAVRVLCTLMHTGISSDMCEYDTMISSRQCLPADVAVRTGWLFDLVGSQWLWTSIDCRVSSFVFVQHEIGSSSEPWVLLDAQGCSASSATFAGRGAIHIIKGPSQWLLAPKDESDIADWVATIQAASTATDEQPDGELRPSRNPFGDDTSSVSASVAASAARSAESRPFKKAPAPSIVVETDLPARLRCMQHLRLIATPARLYLIGREASPTAGLGCTDSSPSELRHRTSPEMPLYRILEFDRTIRSPGCVSEVMRQLDGLHKPPPQSRADEAPTLADVTGGLFDDGDVDQLIRSLTTPGSAFASGPPSDGASAASSTAAATTVAGAAAASGVGGAAAGLFKSFASKIGAATAYGSSSSSAAATALSGAASSPISPPSSAFGASFAGSSTPTNPSASASSSDSLDGDHSTIMLDAVAFLGAIQFMRGYYLVLATRRECIGTVGGHCIYGIRNTELVPIYYESSAANKSTWQKFQDRLGGTDPQTVAEGRYQSLFLSLDLTKDFYYSPTYDVTRPLQQQVVTRVKSTAAVAYPGPSQTAAQHHQEPSFGQISAVEDLVAPASPSTPPVACSDNERQGRHARQASVGPNSGACVKYVWNQHLIREFFRASADDNDDEEIHGESDGYFKPPPAVSHQQPPAAAASTTTSGAMVASSWVTPLAHGLFKQVTSSTFGDPILLTLLARRSRYFAGTRYLKRGVNETGHVANEVESEQILDDTRGHFASFVQIRGSVPVYWMQRTSVAVPKPPILLQPRDFSYEPARRHFAALFARHGAPILMMNLVKKKERHPREKLVGREMARVAMAMNKELPPEVRLQYLSMDYGAIVKNGRLNVLAALRDAGRWAAANCGFFCSTSLSETLIARRERAHANRRSKRNGASQNGANAVLLNTLAAPTAAELTTTSASTPSTASDVVRHDMLDSEVHLPLGSVTSERRLAASEAGRQHGHHQHHGHGHDGQQQPSRHAPLVYVAAGVSGQCEPMGVYPSQQSATSATTAAGSSNATGSKHQRSSLAGHHQAATAASSSVTASGGPRAPYIASLSSISTLQPVQIAGELELHGAIAAAELVRPGAAFRHSRHPDHDDDRGSGRGKSQANAAAGGASGMLGLMSGVTFPQMPQMPGLGLGMASGTAVYPGGGSGSSGGGGASSSSTLAKTGDSSKRGRGSSATSLDGDVATAAPRSGVHYIPITATLPPLLSIDFDGLSVAGEVDLNPPSIAPRSPALDASEFTGIAAKGTSSASSAQSAIASARALKAPDSPISADAADALDNDDASSNGSSSDDDADVDGRISKQAASSSGAEGRGRTGTAAAASLQALTADGRARSKSTVAASANRSRSASAAPGTSDNTADGPNAASGGFSSSPYISLEDQPGFDEMSQAPTLVDSLPERSAAGRRSRGSAPSSRDQMDRSNGASNSSSTPQRNKATADGFDAHGAEVDLRIDSERPYGRVRDQMVAAEAAGSCRFVVCCNDSQDSITATADGSVKVGMAVRLREYQAVNGEGEYLYVDLRGRPHGYGSHLSAAAPAAATQPSSTAVLQTAATLVAAPVSTASVPSEYRFTPPPPPPSAAVVTLLPTQENVTTAPAAASPSPLLSSSQLRFQRGVLRTNCVDCLDRTNVGQVCVGVHMLGLQLYALGLSDSESLDPSGALVRHLMDLYEQHGDAIAMQYGGSEANKKVTSTAHEDSVKHNAGESSEAGAGSDAHGRGGASDKSKQGAFSLFTSTTSAAVAAVNIQGTVSKLRLSSSGPAEILTSLQRYYSNSFTDSIKQASMNLFLGLWRPKTHADDFHLWELESDHYLHNASLTKLAGEVVAAANARDARDERREAAMAVASQSSLIPRGALDSTGFGPECKLGGTQWWLPALESFSRNGMPQVYVDPALSLSHLRQQSASAVPTWMSNELTSASQSTTSISKPAPLAMGGPALIQDLHHPSFLTYFDTLLSAAHAAPQQAAVWIPPPAQQAGNAAAIARRFGMGSVVDGMQKTAVPSLGGSSTPTAASNDAEASAAVSAAVAGSLSGKPPRAPSAASTSATGASAAGSNTPGAGASSTPKGSPPPSKPPRARRTMLQTSILHNEAFGDSLFADILSKASSATASIGTKASAAASSAVEIAAASVERAASVTAAVVEKASDVAASAVEKAAQYSAGPSASAASIIGSHNIAASIESAYERAKGSAATMSERAAAVVRDGKDRATAIIESASSSAEEVRDRVQDAAQAVKAAAKVGLDRASRRLRSPSSERRGAAHASSAAAAATEADDSYVVLERADGDGGVVSKVLELDSLMAEPDAVVTPLVPSLAASDEYPHASDPYAWAGTTADSSSGQLGGHDPFAGSPEGRHEHKRGGDAALYERYVALASSKPVTRSNATASGIGAENGAQRLNESKFISDFVASGLEDAAEASGDIRPSRDQEASNIQAPISTDPFALPFAAKKASTTPASSAAPITNSASASAAASRRVHIITSKSEIDFFRSSVLMGGGGMAQVLASLQSGIGTTTTTAAVASSSASAPQLRDTSEQQQSKMAGSSAGVASHDGSGSTGIEFRGVGPYQLHPLATPSLSDNITQGPYRGLPRGLLAAPTIRTHLSKGEASRQAMYQVYVNGGYLSATGDRVQLPQSSGADVGRPAMHLHHTDSVPAPCLLVTTGKI